MLNGVRIYSSDHVWRQILTDLGATVVDAPCATDLKFDDIRIDLPVSPLQLKTVILDALDNSEIIRSVFGHYVALSRVAEQIVSALYKSGGMSATELKIALGYARDATTHAVDTAICGLRKTYGHDFIQNDNGIYKLGRI